MGSEDDGELRDVLLSHSDERAVREVFGAYAGQDEATLDDYAEAMRRTDGALAVIATDGAAEVYARWNGRAGRFERLTIMPPWTVGGYDHSDAAGLVAALEDVGEPRPVLHDDTPFADEAVLASLSQRTWP